MGNGAVLKRLGYLIDALQLGPLDLRQRLNKRLSAGYAVLDPLASHEGVHDTRWRVLVNVSASDLTGWRET